MIRLGYLQTALTLCKHTSVNCIQPWNYSIKLNEIQTFYLTWSKCSPLIFYRITVIMALSLIPPLTVGPISYQAIYQPAQTGSFHNNNMAALCRGRHRWKRTNCLHVLTRNLSGNNVLFKTVFCIDMEETNRVRVNNYICLCRHTTKLQTCRADVTEVTLFNHPADLPVILSPLT